MKRACLLGTVVCSMILLGCGGQPTDLSKQVQTSTNKSVFPVKGDVEGRSSPEFVAAHTESAHERANYLHGLSSDAKFDPKQHVEMLKKYESDPNPEVSTAAKELLTKVQ